MQPQTMWQAEPQPVMQTQQPVYIQTAPPPPRSNIKPNFPRQSAMALAGFQTAIGVACVLLNSTAISVTSRWQHCTVNPIGAGIWCGIQFIIAGAVGLAAARAKTNCLILSFMMMCILSAVLTLTLFAVSGIEVSGVRSRYGCFYDWDAKSGSLAINAVMLILAFLELVIAIVACSLCCNVLCGGRVMATPAGPQYQQQQAVYYVNQPGGVTYVRSVAPGTSYYNQQPVAYTIQPRGESVTTVSFRPF